MNLFEDFKDSGLGHQPIIVKLKGEKEYDTAAIGGHKLFRDQPKFIVFFVRYDTSKNILLAEE